MACRGEPFSSPGHASEPQNRRSHASINMKGKQKPTAEQEPMGIVISRGPRNEKAPTFYAYMWAPDPEGDDKAMTEPRVA